LETDFQASGEVKQLSEKWGLALFVIGISPGVKPSDMEEEKKL